MALIPLKPEGAVRIDGYGAMGFRISGERFEGAILIVGDSVLHPSARGVEEMAADIAALLDADPRPEILLVGCGERMVPLPAMPRKDLRAAGVGTEPMDTGAACRTYNLLRREERRVAALLFPVP